MKNYFTSLRTYVLLMVMSLPVFHAIAQSTPWAGKPITISNVVRNQCPETTFNLSTVIYERPSAPFSIRWFNTPTPTGQYIVNPTVVTGGTYYAFYYNSETGQYSQASDAVVTETNACANYTPSTLPKFQLVPLTQNNFGTSSLSASINYTSGICSNPSNNQVEKLISSTLSSYPVVINSCDPVYGVKSTNGTFPAKTFAGFKVSKAEITAISNFRFTLSLYAGGNLVESKELNLSNLNDGLYGSYPVEATTAILGYTSSVAFDEVRIKYESGGAPLVYHAVVGNFNSSLNDIKPNVLTPLSTNNAAVTVGGKVNGLCLVCGIANVENVISPDSSKAATIVNDLSIGGGHKISVKDHNVTYPAGTFAGFTVSYPGLLSAGVLNNLSIKTYKDGVLQETLNSTNLLTTTSSLLTLSANKTTVGLLTTKDWNEIEIGFISTVGLLSNPQVHEVVVQRFDATNAITTPNVLTSLTNPTFPVSINPQRTGVEGLACVGCVVQNPTNVTSDFEGDYASINMPVNLLGATGTISVTNPLQDIPAGTYVGFEISNPNLLDLSLLDAIEISTYKDGNFVEKASGATQLVGVNLGVSSVTGRRIIGFMTTQDADELAITVNGGLLSVSLGEVRVYRAVTTQFSSPTLDCNETYDLVSPQMPVVIGFDGTGTNGAVCALATIADAEALITADTTDYAVVTIPVGVLCQASLAVQTYNTVFPKGSTVAYTIEAPNTILQLDLLNYVTIQTYRNGTLVETSSGSNLINLELLGLFGSNNRYKVKFKTSLGNYDEVRILFGGLANVLTAYKVYGSSIETRGSNAPDLNLVCCAAENVKLQIKALTDITDCPEDVVNLNNNLATLCPTGTNLRWYTTNDPAQFNSTTLVSDPTSVSVGTYYAVCYDPEINCFGIPSDEVEITLAECCPETSIVATVAPTACGTNTGSFTIGGLSSAVTNYVLTYTYNGDVFTYNNITPDSVGNLVVNNLSAGEYTNIVISNDACPDGSTPLTVTIADPAAPDAPVIPVDKEAIAVCNGQSALLVATCNTGNVIWYADAALTQSVGTTVSPSTTTTYYAVCEVNNCKSVAATTVVTVNPIVPAPTVTASTPIVLAGEASTLTATCTSGAVVWYGDLARQDVLGTGATLVVNPTATTTYYAACGTGECADLAPITITVNAATFDLALTLSRAIGQEARVSVGDTVAFTITVKNEGNLTATNTQVINYIPSGLTLLNDANWTLEGANAILATPIATLAPGATAQYTIRFVVDNANQLTITNAAEIASSLYNGVAANDIDSVADKIKGNDLHNGIFEDDYDEASVSICPTGNCMSAKHKRIK